MTQSQRKTSTTRRHYSPSATVRVGDAPIVLPLLVAICLLCGASLVGSFWSISEARKAEREARVLQVKVEAFENVLHANKLPTSVH